MSCDKTLLDSVAICRMCKVYITVDGKHLFLLQMTAFDFTAIILFETNKQIKCSK